MDYYLSALIGKPVVNQSNEKIGEFIDAVLFDPHKSRPRVHGILVKRPGTKQLIFVPATDIKDIKNEIRLDTDVVDLTPFAVKTDEIRLADQIYDKQIVDIDDRRLTRVNDLLLDYQKGLLYLTGVDVSSFGVLNRLKIPTFGLVKPNIVEWHDVQFLGGNAPVKFKVQYKNLESLHPVDIARIIFEGPGYKHGSRVLSELKDPIAADIIEELSPKLQRNLIESMKLEDVAGVVDQMEPDKATDLLVTLGPDYTKKIMPLLSKNNSQTISSLLHYPEHSTGAYMTTDYLAVPSGITMDKLFDRFRDQEEISDFSYYIYVLENELSNKLIGVLSNHDFLTANPRSRIENVMSKKLITAHPLDSIKESLKKMYRYDLSAIPVLSQKEGKLLGIVTFKDAISVYLPRRWKVRIRRIFSNEN